LAGSRLKGLSWRSGSGHGGGDGRTEGPRLWLLPESRTHGETRIIDQALIAPPEIGWWNSPSRWAGTCGASAVSDRGSGAAKTVLPLAPKLNSESEPGDPLDKAGQAILGMVHQASNSVEANNQHALEVAHKLSAQLRAAEDRIRELETHMRHYQERADCAEKWLHRVSLEIEQPFFGREMALTSQLPSPQALLRSQRQ
jgi:hypothetical protein